MSAPVPSSASGATVTVPVRTIGDFTLQLSAARRALRRIVNVLGPEQICECGWDDVTCGLREEAALALETAIKALEALSP
jgi:hypothetical protein